METDILANGYVVVTGHGRSGSNMLLDMLNEHPRTMCRNEPDAMATSPMKALPDGFFDADMAPDFLEVFQEVLGRALLRNSVRDNFGLVEKVWFRSQLRALIGQELLRNKHTRRLLGVVNPALCRDEWQTPSFYVDRRLAKQALPVFKIILASGWLLRTHDADPGQRILHIIREPVDFLRSWANRYIKRHAEGGEQVYQTNCETMPRIFEHFGVHSSCLTKFSTEHLIETELWRWRYVNETLLQRLGQSDRYRIFRFEDVKARQRDSVSDIFGFCGLELDDRTWGRVALLSNRMFPKISERPFDDVDVEAIICKVLENSPLRAHVVAA